MTEPKKIQDYIKGLSSDISMLKSCLSSMEERLKSLELKKEDTLNLKQSYTKFVESHNTSILAIETRIKEHEAIIVSLKKELEF